jgi:hypothetical protein
MQFHPLTELLGELIAVAKSSRYLEAHHGKHERRE